MGINMYLLGLQFEKQDFLSLPYCIAGVIVADEHTISVESYAQGEFVIVDMHKHSEMVS